MVDRTGLSRGETTLRLAIAAVFLFGVAGTVAELLLLEHFEEPIQYAPFAGLVATGAAMAWALARPGRAAVLAVRWATALLALIGLVGVVLHLRSNLELELEMDPDLGGVPLLWLALRGATPSLAPGMLAQLGLLGFLFTLGHPAIARVEPSDSNDSNDSHRRDIT